LIHETGQRPPDALAARAALAAEVAALGVAFGLVGAGDLEAARRRRGAGDGAGAGAGDGSCAAARRDLRGGVLLRAAALLRGAAFGAFAFAFAFAFAGDGAAAAASSVSSSAALRAASNLVISLRWPSATRSARFCEVWRRKGQQGWDWVGYGGEGERGVAAAAGAAAKRRLAVSSLSYLPRVLAVEALPRHEVLHAPTVLAPVLDALDADLARCSGRRGGTRA
jgi:hypothetical protein